MENLLRAKIMLSDTQKKRLTDFVVEQVRNIGTSIQSATHAGDKGGFLTYISKYKIRRMRSLYKIDSLLIFL